MIWIDSVTIEYQDGVSYGLTRQIIPAYVW